MIAQLGLCRAPCRFGEFFGLQPIAVLKGAIVGLVIGDVIFLVLRKRRRSCRKTERANEQNETKHSSVPFQKNLHPAYHSCDVGSNHYPPGGCLSGIAIQISPEKLTLKTSIPGKIAYLIEPAGEIRPCAEK